MSGETMTPMTPSRWRGGRFAARWRRWAAALGDLAFPPACPFCQADLHGPDPGVELCNDCRESLLLAEDGPRCPRCGARDFNPHESGGGCFHCRKKPLKFDRAMAMGTYDGDLRAAVLQMKRAGAGPLALAMGRALARRLVESLASDRPDVVVPVPMHWSRRIARGCNSAELLAESAAAELDLPSSPRLLVRSRNTAPQFELPPRERFRNVRGAFCVRMGYDLTDARVLLIDDILTTGATASDAARALGERGARQVSVAVLARAESLAR